MSFNLSGSLYNQALQVQKAVKLGGHDVDKKKTNYTQAYTEAYKAGEIDPRPKFPEPHKLDVIG